MRIVLAGASGLIGTALAADLRGRGDQVVRLVRRPVAAADEVRWDPGTGMIDTASLSGADAVVCLSGAGIATHRWSAGYKRTLYLSRAEPLRLLADTLAARAGEPPALLAASAVGYYGDTGAEAVDESAPPGDDFLADLCAGWEACADSARAAGVRVATLRFGIVLASTGGLLAQLVRLARTGLAGPLASGMQYLSWVTLDDVVAAIGFLIDQTITGPVNVVAPHPVTNAEFTTSVAAAVRRPARLRVPAAALRLGLGELADAPLMSQRIRPAVLTAAGFRFQQPELDQALAAVLDQ